MWQNGGSLLEKFQIVIWNFPNSELQETHWKQIYKIYTYVYICIYVYLCVLNSIKGICISRRPALWLVPGPGSGPKFVFTGPGSKLVFTSPGPQFVFTGRGSQFVFTGSDPRFVFTPNLHLPAQPGLSLHIPTLSTQFVFTGPGLWFARTQAAKLIYPQWCWIM